ncbi:SdpI family protein [Brevibacterium sp. FAM 24638]|uniref:SdpI family protein n=1 Tax=Brevibacterium sp. FAM 24638 TaxID=3415681 RepID=UPI003C7C4529
MFYPPLISYLIVGAVSTLLVAAIRRNRLTRNRAIGIRSRHTMASDAAWLRGHHAAIPALIGINVLCCLFALALAGVELLSWPTRLGHILAVTGWILILGACVAAVSKANAAAKNV